MFLNNNNKYDCCGCTACVEICPKSCISFVKDDEGFFYPYKDKASCIDCGLCEKVCPFSDNYTREEDQHPDVYAAYDSKSRIGSSSGGIFYTIAKYVIEEKKGWVFGAAFEDKFQLRHIGVNNLHDMEKLRGSKYVQSHMGDTFSRVKQLLKEGSYVFFVGTPCQVAGLRGFLRKDFENLLTADLVCHGTPSQTIFDEHVKYLQKKHNATLVSYKFRYDDGWGVCEIADFANPMKKSILPSYDLSPYLYSFMYAYTYRYSCYNCKFAKVPRQGDFTLADYWGVKEYFPKIDATKGVSLVLLNNDKGRSVWSVLAKNVVWFKSNIEDASRFNGNLIKKSVEPKIRKNIYKRVFADGYESLAKKEFRSPRYYKIKLFNFVNSSVLFMPLLNIYRKLK